MKIFDQYKQFTFSILFSLGFILLVVTSCSDDFFEAQPGNKLTPEQHFKSIKELDISYNGAFSFLQETSENLVIINGLLSDMMDVTENATPEMLEIYNHNISPKNKFADFSSLYKVIVSCNEIMENIDSLSGYDRYFDEYIEHEYRANLVSLRSWAYFMASRLYGEVVILDDNLATYAPGSNFERLNKETLLPLLIDELRPYTKDRQEPFDEEEDPIMEIYSTKWINASALMADMFLESNIYDSAWYYAKEAIDGVERNEDKFKLNDDFEKEIWGFIFNGATNNTSTVLSAVNLSLDYKQPNMLEQYFMYDYSIKPGQVILDLFNSQKTMITSTRFVEFDLYRGFYTYDTLDAETPRITKYSVESGKGFSADNIIMRAADVHLIMIEALNRMGEHDDALLFINNGINSGQKPNFGKYTRWTKNLGVRGRVSLEALPATTDMLLLEDQIIDERAMELAFEGKRWLDLIRIAERRNDPAYLANRVAAKYSNPVKREEVRAKLMNPENWYLPKDY